VRECHDEVRSRLLGGVQELVVGFALGRRDQTEGADAATVTPALLRRLDVEELEPRDHLEDLSHVGTWVDRPPVSVHDRPLPHGVHEKGLHILHTVRAEST